MLLFDTYSVQTKFMSQIVDNLSYSRYFDNRVNLDEEKSEMKEDHRELINVFFSHSTPGTQAGRCRS